MKNRVTKLIKCWMWSLPNQRLSSLDTGFSQAWISALNRWKCHLKLFIITHYLNSTFLPLAVYKMVRRGSDWICSQILYLRKSIILWLHWYSFLRKFLVPWSGKRRISIPFHIFELTIGLDYEYKFQFNREFFFFLEYIFSCEHNCPCQLGQYHLQLVDGGHCGLRGSFKCSGSDDLYEKQAFDNTAQYSSVQFGGYR